MPALPPGQARRLILGPRVLLCTGALLAACASHDPQAIAREADRTLGSEPGVYAWLAEHDPSALVVAGLDAQSARAVAPDARVREAPDVPRGCVDARRTHALLAALARTGTPARDRAEDCGYALYRDAASIVVAPR